MSKVPTGLTSCQDLHIAYKRWCIARCKTKNQHRQGPKGYNSSPVFSRRLTKLHQRARHTMCGSIYDGLVLNNIFEEVYASTQTREERER